MRFISKIVLLLGLLSSALFSSVNVDECKSDLYYANGIMMKDSENKARINLNKKVVAIFVNNQESFNKLGKIDISYNASQDFFSDIFESLEQVMSNEWGWESFSGYFRTYLELKGYQDSVDQHRPNLDTQVNAYKQSIKDGHGVIIIAHSQGNYYTNEAYEELDGWMKDYFHMFGVATPANHVAGYAVDDASAPYVKFHNDIINIIMTSLPSNRESTKYHGFPSYYAHDFYESYLKDENTKNDISNFILNQIQVHANSPSQWETESEYEKGTKEYRIAVKHRFDTNIENIENVYPFASSKKLYQVAGEYVKASCGGTKILDADIDPWDGIQENELLMINNPEEEKITGCISIEPILSGVASADEETNIEITIDNYIADNIYDINVTGGSTARNGATITWTLPAVTEDETHTLSIYTEQDGCYIKSKATFDTIVINCIIGKDIYITTGAYSPVSPNDFSFDNTTMTQNDTTRETYCHIIQGRHGGAYIAWDYNLRDIIGDDSGFEIHLVGGNPAIYPWRYTSLWVYNTPPLGFDASECYAMPGVDMGSLHIDYGLGSNIIIEIPSSTDPIYLKYNNLWSTETHRLQDIGLEVQIYIRKICP